VVVARLCRPPVGIAGSLRVSESFSPPATCTWSSHCQVAWHHWPCKTRRSSTTSCSAAVQKPYSKWLAIPDTSVQRLVSSVSCIRGVKNSPPIRMSIVWCLLVTSRSITPVGFVPGTTTSCPELAERVARVEEYIKTQSSPTFDDIYRMLATILQRAQAFETEVINKSRQVHADQNAYLQEVNNKLIDRFRAMEAKSDQD